MACIVKKTARPYRFLNDSKGEDLQDPRFGSVSFALDAASATNARRKKSRPLRGRL